MFKNEYEDTVTGERWYGETLYPSRPAAATAARNAMYRTLDTVVHVGVVEHVEEVALAA